MPAGRPTCQVKRSLNRIRELEPCCIPAPTDHTISTSSDHDMDVMDVQHSRLYQSQRFPGPRILNLRPRQQLMMM